jgi:hypothetical protein
MKVRLIERRSGELIYKTRVNLCNIDGRRLSEADFFDEAWLSAVCDGAVKEKMRHDYIFILEP